MAQTMQVSVMLRLVDQFTQNARAAAANFQQLVRSAQDFNRSLGGAGAANGFARMLNDVRTLSREMRSLLAQFNQFGRSAVGGVIGGSLGQRQIAELRQILQLQQQAIANSNRLQTGGGGGPGGGRSGIFGRGGFNPNASLIDRLQFHGVNLGQRTLIEGVLDLDRARTNLAMLAMPRRDPDNEGRTLSGVITPEIVAQAEVAAAELSQVFRALNRAHILDTFREMVTQFSEPTDAFKVLPQLLAIQEWQVLQGDTVEQAREGMARLIRAMGLSGRLVDNEGRINMAETTMFLENYIRARIIGGRDVTPSEVFNVMKYLKQTGQTMTPEAILTAFIGMPDIRGSTFGHQLEMLRSQLMGRATQAAQRAMVEAGLGTITAREGSGPHSFQVVDPVLLNENIFEWFNKHIMGPEGFLRRRGIDPLRASAAEIATALNPIFSNTSARNIANAIVNQQAEWRTQIENALRFNLSEEARSERGADSLWYQFQSARSALAEAIGATASNFRTLLLPALRDVTDGLKKLGQWFDPVLGRPEANLGVLAAGGFAGFLGLRAIWRTMGPWGRALAGSGLGLLMGGGPADILLGALLGRSMGGSGADAAIGAAGAAAATTWGSRFLAVLRTILRSAPGMIALAIGGQVLTDVFNNWDQFKERILGIFKQLEEAAPWWLGGGDRGLEHLRGGPLLQGLRELDEYVGSSRLQRRMVDWFDRTLFENNPEEWARFQFHRAQNFAMRRGVDLERLSDEARLFGIPQLPPTDATTHGKGSIQQMSVTTGPINVTVNVAQTGASPQAIGEAAGGAVGSGLRGALSDVVKQQ